MKYRTIIADPPWPYRNKDPFTGKPDGKGAPADVYPPMSYSEIASLPVGDLADNEAHLYVWLTCPLIFECQIDRMMDGWGFIYKTLLTWNKTGPTGLGNYFRVRTEHVAFGVRGRLAIPAASREQNIFHAKNRHHSEKPEAFMDLVERVSPAPRLELFARRQRLGWDTWGNEALEHVEMVS